MARVVNPPELGMESRAWSRKRNRWFQKKNPSKISGTESWFVLCSKLLCEEKEALHGTGLRQLLSAQENDQFRKSKTAPVEPF